MISSSLLAKLAENESNGFLNLKSITLGHHAFKKALRTTGPGFRGTLRIQVVASKQSESFILTFSPISRRE